jgi:DNA processing protein
MGACDTCLRRTWLLGRLAGYLGFERGRIEDTLSLDDRTLIGLWRESVDGDVRREYAGFGTRQADAARARAQASGMELLCVCEPTYPERLFELPTPPAVLHVAGGVRRFLELAAADPVAVVGARQATEYGRDVATLLGRGISASGLTVVSGMARGVDAAAHRGALAAGGRTIAVLPGSAMEPYPKQHRSLHAEIIGSGVAVSEMGPGTSTHKWTFIARNRVIAALSRLTIIVQARSDSGALSTVGYARALQRRVGAVPGSVLLRQSEGPHAQLADGAALIRDAQDVLDTLYGAGARTAANPDLTGLDPLAVSVLEAVAGGADTLAAVTRAGVESGQAMTTLAGLELAGLVRRGAGGRYVATSGFS